MVYWWINMMIVSVNGGEMIKDYILLKDKKWNCVRFRKGESWPHRLRKMEVCNWLYDNGYSFYTEAEFTTGGRADIVVIEPQEFIVEVIYSEEFASIQKKKKMYPSEDIRTTRTENQFIPEAIL